MLNAKFQPGFRCSVVDALVLALGLSGALWIWPRASGLGLVMAFVVGHFFLFCNVFRISRNLELIWAASYLAVTLLAHHFYATLWTPIMLLPLMITAIVIGVELRKPSYHGIGWQHINPGLLKWWDVNQQP